MDHTEALENSWRAFAETGEIGAFLIYAALRQQIQHTEN